MTPIQSEALDLAARIFIWGVRLIGLGVVLFLIFAIIFFVAGTNHGATS